MSNTIQKKYKIMNLQTGKSAKYTSHLDATEYMMREQGEYDMSIVYEVIDSTERNYDVSIIMPIWGKPRKTKRAIESVCAQNRNGWQLICVGDGCPLWESELESSWLRELQAEAYMNDNEIITVNRLHEGGYGYAARNYGISIATGNWIMYLDNDDVIKHNHISERMIATEKNHNIDMFYFNTWIEPKRWHREAELQYGSIGHSEVMFRAEFLKKMPPANSQYGHDWVLIEAAINAGANTCKISGEYTYIVKSLPDSQEQGFE